MKKVLLVFMVVLVTTVLFSFTEKDKKVKQTEPRRWDVVLGEIYGQIGSGQMVKLTPKLEVLFNELYQLRPDLIEGSGPNADENLLKFCWWCNCTKCGYQVKQCKFFHSCSYCCDMCQCLGGVAAGNCPCWDIYVGNNCTLHCY